MCVCVCVCMCVRAWVRVCVRACVRACAWRYLRLGDELGDLLAGVERGHLHVGHPPVGPPRGVQDLVMLLQDLAETSEVQVLRGGEESESESESETALLQTTR